VVVDGMEREAVAEELDPPGQREAEAPVDLPCPIGGVTLATEKTPTKEPVWESSA